MRAHRSQRGSILPLVALLVVAAGGLVLGVGRLGAAAAQRTRAVAAADAAALAGAAEGEEAARELAAANGARLVAFEADGAEVEVRVSFRGAEARARARRTGGAPAVGARDAASGLSPAMLAVLARAEQLLGEAVPITSGYRTTARQSALWARRGSSTLPVAPPGSSAHERGMAVDVPRSFVPRLAAVAAAAGLCRPLPRTDPVHFEPCRWSRAAT